eukprot:gene13728-biopygen3988
MAGWARLLQCEVFAACTTGPPRFPTPLSRLRSGSNARRHREPNRELSLASAADWQNERTCKCLPNMCCQVLWMRATDRPPSHRAGDRSSTVPPSGRQIVYRPTERATDRLPSHRAGDRSSTVPPSGRQIVYLLTELATDRPRRSSVRPSCAPSKSAPSKEELRPSKLISVQGGAPSVQVALRPRNAPSVQGRSVQGGAPSEAAPSKKRPPEAIA